MRLRKSVVNSTIWIGIILAGLWVIVSSEVGNIPSGALLAISAIAGWWLLGNVHKESHHNR